MLFNYESFKNLLKEIKDVFQYNFLRFDQKILPDLEKIIFLRHDIDISPYYALQLGKIEHSMNIKANYFFQIGAETYNIFNPKVIDIIKELSSFGHCVGLHIDEVLFGDNDNKIHSTLKWFQECITDVNFVVSFHRPTKPMLNKEYDSFINAYQNGLFLEANFLSDSRKNEEFYPKLLNLLKEGKSPIQLLLHPAWWYPEEDLNKFKDELIKRRTSELKNYLKTNFKNMQRIIEDENRSFRL